MTAQDEVSSLEMEVGSSLLPKEKLFSPMSEENFRKANNYSAPETPKISRKLKKQLTCNKSIIFDHLPILHWLPRYNFKSCFLGDLIAGLTVSVLQIPHGLAFAPLAGQEPVVGLYMAVFPLMMYSILGTSKHISLGMMGILIVIVGKIVDTHATPKELIMNGTTDGYSALQVGITVTFTVGMWQLILGVLQMGSLCVLLSSSLVSAFTCGASFHIVFLQLKHIFGIDLNLAKGPLKLFYSSIRFFDMVPETNIAALSTASIFIFILFVFNEYIKPRLAKKTKIPIPMEFIVIVAGIILSEFLDFEQRFDVKTVGNVPSGLPDLVVPSFSLIPPILVDCLIIALVGISINISLAKIFAKKCGYNINDNQELKAYGLSNIFGSFTQCIPTAASLSRSMVQYTAGGKTEMAHIVSMLSVLTMLMFLGPMFSKLPLCVLASIVMVSVKGLLFQIKDFPKIWKASRLDGTVWLVTFLFVILFDIDVGIGVGLFASVITLVFYSIQTKVLVLGKMKNPNRFLDVDCYQALETHPRINILKIVGGINFYNSSSVCEQILKIVEKVWDKCSDKEYRLFTIIDLSAVPAVDPSALASLLTTIDVIKKNNCDVILTNCSSNVYNSLQICKFFQTFPKEYVMMTINSALKYIHDNKLIL